MLESNVKTGADVLVEELINLGVDTIFCITGAGNLAIVDAVFRSNSIKLVFSHHEQSAVMEANGYSRVSGKIGVALVTTGGGTTNVATGVLSANLDSVPILVISGNESSFHLNKMKNLRAVGVQGFDSVAFLKPLVKFSYRLRSESEIKDSVEKCFRIAQTPRKGVVHLDLPMDLQRKPVDKFDGNSDIDMTRFLPDLLKSDDLKKSVFLALDDLSVSRNPALYIGEGCRGIKSLDLLRSWIVRKRIPFFLSWSAIDLFDEENDLNAGRIGIYGSRASNILLQKCDFLLCLGTRLSIPQIGYDVNDFARLAKIWSVEVDSSEIEKYPPHWKSIHANVSDFIELAATTEREVSNPDSFSDWVQECKRIISLYPKETQINKTEIDSASYIHSFDVVDSLCDVLPPNSIVTTDVGAGLLTGHYAFRIKSNQRLFTSQGLGEMGFGLPASIGAYFANTDAKLICLNTDGGIMFNLQELQLVKEHKIPLKLFIFNNAGYSMISISQKNLYGGRLIGSSSSSGLSFPNFNQLADLFGLEYIKIQSSKDVNSSLLQIQSDTAQLFEVIMDPNQRYLPRLSTSAKADGSLISPPLEDLEPLLEIEELQNALGYRPHKNSFTVRGLEVN